MGLSSDAILFYGLELGEDSPFIGQDVDDIETSWNNEHGCPEPPDSKDYRGAEWKAWRKEKDEWEKTGNGIRVGCHCCDGDPIEYVTLMAHEYTAFRGHAEKVDPAKLEPTQEQKDSLLEFCEKYGIDCSEPGWFLVSWMG
jgi:hypothetical protein